ncbi:MAG: CHAT domain-containing protein [candidate division KSB1 bacterium]|nr:CHAT domain-containing protein [candidate division KSB1 bacterium]MDZ7301289.1 CHAT domain-containing protein [candidate division KSB1 bacterium]MDZ7310826.1 CHAT domain-containing protein [candidate division KSB1 bacterium]
MKKYLIGFLLAAILAATAIWWFNRKPTLADLQKQYLSAKTEKEKNKIIDRLEKYYRNLEVPPAISDSIDHDFSGLLKRTIIDLSAYTDGKAEDKNPYALENDLKNLVRNALVAHVRKENEIFRQLMDHAHKMAAVVDAGTQNNYWVPFVKRVSFFDKAHAEAWLKADLAQTRCKAYQDSEGRFTDAEFHASLGLKFLQQASDERLQLDFMQRLQYILYYHRSMYELSLALAQKSLPQAEKIKYHLRSNGITYHQAEVLASIGQNQAALGLYATVIQNTQQFPQIPDMNWFAITGSLGKGKVYVELGEFDKAFEACNDVETHRLPDRDRIRLRRLRSDIFRSMVNYEQAEEELQKAMALAESTRDTFNLIMCLNSYGVLFERLGEYDLAIDYYNQAKSLFRPSGPDISTRVRIINNIVDVIAAKKDFVQFEKISQEVGRLVKFANMPSREAELLRNLGNMYKKVHKNSAAIEYFHEADSLFNSNGFLRLALGTRIDLVDCLINLSRLNEAQTLISEVELLARQLNDVERIIDAIGRIAKIQYQKGNIAQAVESSNRLLLEIEEMSSRFNNADRLMAYRQKIYDFLKNAVFYEITLHRPDSAFVKLDYAKAYAVKSQLLNRHRGASSHAGSRKYLNLDSIITNLHERSLVIDYMVAEDTLYAFTLDQKGLQLLSKSINMEDLEKTVSAYKDSIARTIQVFQHYDANKMNLHYSSTVEIGQKLYNYLLEWPELKSRLQQAELLYIIPDEFLCEIPFATLIAKNSDSRTFIVHHASVLNLPSAGFLQFKNTVPVVNKLDKGRVLISADQRLPGTEKFVSKVKALFPLTEELKVEKSTFTKDDVLEKLQENYQIYIFVGHGSGNPKYPDRSYIELSVKTPNTPVPKLIRLSLSDLKEMKWLDTEIVMLIGCETASGKLYRGTGISGLHLGFLGLGAQNVLGNLWEVDADHAISQAEDFLASWVTSWNSSQALRECQLKAVKELQGHSYYKQPHPYFWGNSILLTVRHQ